MSKRCRICNTEMVVNEHIGPNCAKKFKLKMYSVPKTRQNKKYEAVELSAVDLNFNTTNHRVAKSKDMNYSSLGSSTLLLLDKKNAGNNAIEKERLVDFYGFLDEQEMIPEGAKLVGLYPNKIRKDMAPNFLGAIEISLFEDADSSDRNLMLYCYESKDDGSVFNYIREYGYKDEDDNVVLINSAYNGNVFVGENIFLHSQLDTIGLEEYIGNLQEFRGRESDETLDEDGEDAEDLIFDKFMAQAFVNKTIRRYQGYDDMFDNDNDQDWIDYLSRGSNIGLMREVIILESIKYRKDPKTRDMGFFKQLNTVPFLRGIFEDKDLKVLMDHLDKI